VCNTKVVGIERTIDTPHDDIPHCFILGPLPGVLQKTDSDKSFRAKHLQHYTDDENTYIFTDSDSAIFPE